MVSLTSLYAKVTNNVPAAHYSMLMKTEAVQMDTAWDFIPLIDHESTKTF